MKPNAEATRWSRRYRTALRRHLQQGTSANRQSAAKLGTQAVALGLETLDLARFHTQALMVLAPPGASYKIKHRWIDRATAFFSETVVPIERTHRAALDDDIRADRLNLILHQRTAESSDSARRLKRSISERRGAEQALKKSGRQHIKLLAEANRLQKQLRRMTQARLSSQEHERQKMSHRLRNDIAQTLLGIHVRLLALKRAAEIDTENLKKEIANTQQLVETFGKRIKRFAHEKVFQYET